jgi:hypothetical protein
MARMIRNFSRSALAALALPLALPLLAVSGCNPYREGGSEASYDGNVYVSTSDQPKTVFLRDTRDGSEIWSYEIPVGRKLVVQFFHDRYDNSTRPDMMRWDEMAPDNNYGSLKNEMAVPKTRIIGFDLREPGESAPGVKPKGKPVGGGSAPF